MAIVLVCAALASPLVTEAQPAAKAYRIGILSPGSAAQSIGGDAFRQRLRELGWRVGQDLILELRYADGKLDRLPDLAADLVRLKVSLILAFGTPASLAAKRGTATIPIVLMAADPVGSGLVTSLARPGGNITGLTPEASLDLTNPPEARVREAILVPARTLGLTVLSVEVRSPDDLNDAFAALSRERAEALTAAEDPSLVEQMQLIIDFAARNRLPTVFGGRVLVDAGGLMSYGTDWVDLLRRSATFIDRILRGAKPGDLPIEQPTKFELVINLKTAKAPRADHSPVPPAPGGQLIGEQ